MKIMVIGGGGREHAIIKSIKKNKEVTEIFALPGNGGIAAVAKCIPIPATDLDAAVNFAVLNKIDYVIVAPDDPLAMGLVDRLAEKGIPAFGPSAAAARIESSKVFSKNLMKKYSIPTAGYEVFTDPQRVIEYIKEKNVYPAVIKADGLALGKGVMIVNNLGEAEAAVKSIMEDKIFGDSGKSVVVEEFLTGPEVSVLSFTDGKTIVPMVSSMDHKRAQNGDCGPNTGGMGTIAPNPFYTDEIAAECMEKIFLPTVKAMNSEGCPFCGCLYFGLMLTPDGPKVIEYNCRFGDPETQVVLPLLKTDLLSVMRAVTDRRLSEVEVEFSNGSAACVVLASGGYPLHYEKGKKITFSGDVPKNITVFHAGTKLQNGGLVTSGGRVLGITATAPTLRKAVDDAYATVKAISFDGAFCRSDIGKKALGAVK